MYCLWLIWCCQCFDRPECLLFTMTVPEGANTNESQIHKAGDEEEEEEEKNLEDLIKKGDFFPCFP